MEKKYFLINVIDRKHGYSMLVKCKAKDEDEALEMACDVGIFQDEEDADHAVVEEASDYDIKAFGDNVIELD